MNGGRIDVFGSAGDWAGAQLAGGLIHIHGSAGHRIGAAYRGSRRGMTGGTLLVDGSAGDEVGSAMRRGLIGIRESCGDFLGVSLCAGTIAVCGEVGIRCGAGMRRGTLILSGAHPVELPPTFRRSARVSLVALRLIFGQLEQAGLAVPPPMRTSAYELFQGDFLEGGRGEVLIGLPVVGSANLGL
jgi:formylmethanofuran dehydrogenase subunit C